MFKKYYLCYCQDKKAKCIGPFNDPVDADRYDNKLKQFTIMTAVNLWSSNQTAIDQFKRDTDNGKDVGMECEN